MGQDWRGQTRRSATALARAARLAVVVAVVGLASNRGVGAEPPARPERPTIALDEYRARRQALVADLRASGGGEAAIFRRAMARADGGDGSAPPVLVVLIGSGGPGDDSRFHQASDFRYLTGIDQPGAAVILRVDRDEETLYLPPRSRRDERYTGPKLGPGPEASSATGFGRVAATGAFLADLFLALGDPIDGRSGRGAIIYLVEPTEPLAGGRDAWLAHLVRQGAPGAKVRDLADRIHERRKTKSPAEVALIRRAIAATADAQASVAKLAAPGVTENRLEGAILAAFLAGGAQRAGFPSIVGSGPNSTVLHYERNDRTVGAGELVVVDIGAEVDGYTADITRTVPADGQFTPRQREVYQLVLEAQTGAARLVRPGVSTIGSLNLWVIQFFRESPLRARDEAGVERTMDHFFPHGLGHHLGLDVHDVGDASKPLEPGQVFTIEPGLYLPAEGFGVRIEDDYLVTPTGVEKLSEAIPSSVEAIERPALSLGRPPTIR